MPRLILMGALSKHQLVSIMIVAFITGMMTAALGDRAWIVMPPVALVLMLVMMAMDGRRPITMRWVLGAALMSLAIGVFLKIT
jgi:hypothetical protein